jgi:hypothetical protein
LAEEDIKQIHPWYEIIEASDELEQGDFVDNCEIFVPRYIPSDSANDAFTYKAEIDSYKMNVIVITQSCDLGNNKGLEHVLVCLRKPSSAYKKPDTNIKQFYSHLEEIRKGQRYRYYMLHESNLPDYLCETQIVDLGSVFSVPYNIIKQMVKLHDKRLRLRSPYQEKLAQAFGYYYMRIGLPVDIPEFNVKALAKANANSIQQN